MNIVRDMRIITVTYFFEWRGLRIESHEIVKETEKYYYGLRGKITRKISKADMDKFVRKPACPYSRNSTYLRFYMIDATVEDVKKKLSDWFFSESQRVLEEYNDVNVI